MGEYKRPASRPFADKCKHLSNAHPATLTPQVLPLIREWKPEKQRYLQPYGIGKIGFTAIPYAPCKSYLPLYTCGKPATVVELPARGGHLAGVQSTAGSERSEGVVWKGFY